MKNKQQPKQQEEPLYKFKSAIYPRTFWVYFGNDRSGSDSRNDRRIEFTR